MRLLLLLLLSFLANADKYDQSKIYSIFDEVKVRLGQVYYCTWGDPSSLSSPWRKVDLYAEEMVVIVDGKILDIRPITNIEVSKTSVLFRSPPQGGEGPISDRNYWRKWVIDKINSKGNYSFFYRYPNGSWLDPIEEDCLSSIPSAIKKY